MSQNNDKKRSMECQSKLGEYAILAIILCISLFVHLAIIYGVAWSPGGAEHASPPAMVGQHRLTVTLTPPSHATAAKKSAALKKSDALAVTDVDTRTNTDSDNNLSAMKKVISTSLTSRYFSLAELDQHPSITRNISDNPPELRDYPQGGEIVFRLWIDKTGKVVNVDTISSTLPQIFADSARASFLKAAFSPGRKNGNAVASVMDVAITYAPIK